MPKEEDISAMPIWKLEACRDDERIACRWGYVIADTEANAVAAGRESSGMTYVLAHRLDEQKAWPGSPDERIFWSS